MSYVRQLKFRRNSGLKCKMSDKKNAMLDPSRARVIKAIREETKGGFISSNPSSQALMAKLDPYSEVVVRNSSEESIDSYKAHYHPVKSPNFVSKADWLTLAVLTFVNLINYMDRYTIAGTIITLSFHTHKFTLTFGFVAFRNSLIQHFV